jgi:hypothetical protein
MAYSEVTSHADKTRTAALYAYDALGRRAVTEGAAGQKLRTVYDGKGFEAIREGETFLDGSLTTRHAASAPSRAGGPLQSSQPTGERYRWIGEGGATGGGDGYAAEGGRYGSRGVTLYGKGEAVAVSYSSSAANCAVYLGKDVMGSVRSASTDAGSLESRGTSTTRSGSRTRATYRAG